MRRILNNPTRISLGLTALALLVAGVMAIFKAYNHASNDGVPRRTPLKTRKRTAPKRFYYLKSDSGCTDERAGLFLDAYINDAIEEQDLMIFRGHVPRCLACAVRLANAKTMRAASEHYGKTLANDPDFIESLGLTVVDVMGEPLIEKYRQLLDCRQISGATAHDE